MILIIVLTALVGFYVGYKGMGLLIEVAENAWHIQQDRALIRELQDRPGVR